jgi:hypothetical protein
MSPVVARSAEVPRRPVPPPHLPDVHVAPAPLLVPQVPILDVTKWEYKHLARASNAPALDEAALNELGSEGWELVGTITDGSGTHFYFKREAR